MIHNQTVCQKYNKNFQTLSQVYAFYFSWHLYIFLEYSLFHHQAFYPQYALNLQLIFEKMNKGNKLRFFFQHHFQTLQDLLLEPQTVNYLNFLEHNYLCCLGYFSDNLTTPRPYFQHQLFSKKKVWPFLIQLESYLHNFLLLLIYVFSFSSTCVHMLAHWQIYQHLKL